LLEPDDYARVEERIDAATRLRQTYLAMRDLPEQDRKLLELVAVDGLSTRDAASALLITPVAARVRLSRARSRLRSALNENDRPETRALHTVQEGSA
jgi:RNA polymerase sigma-70 factor (ECF subfamily)